MRTLSFSAGLTTMLTGALLAGGGCSGDVAPAKGQLMVVLQSDMSVPKDINRAQVLITVQGKVVFTKLYIADVAGELKLPGTIAVVAGEKEADQVVVQVVGIDKNGEALTFNKAVTTMPRSRMATLRMPMQWLCSGQVDTLPNSGDPVYASSCRDTSMGEQSCLAGSCASIEVDEASLPTFNAPEVFGGGEYPNDPSGQCFDVQSCFKLGVTLTPDLDPNSATYCQASVTIPAGADLNFAVNTGPKGAGVCDDKNADAPCFVVLDQNEMFGWTPLEGATPTVMGGIDPGGSDVGVGGRSGSGSGSGGSTTASAGGVAPASGGSGVRSDGGAPASGGNGIGGGSPSAGQSSGTGGAAVAGAGGVGSPPVSSYISSGNWHGHIFTATGAGSVINPNPPGVTDFPICVSGFVAPTDDSSNYALVGFNLDQAPNAANPLETLPENSSGGVDVQLTNDGGSPLRVQLAGPKAGADPNQQWCREIFSPSGELVPWDSFSNQCWLGDGASYSAVANPIVSINVVVPGSTVITPFDFCIDDISEAFILPKLKPPLQPQSITPPGLHPLQAGGGDVSGTVVVQFPTAVCDRLNDDPSLLLSATAACEAKTEQTPLCGPWSTASAPQVPNPDVMLPGDAPGDTGAGGMSGSPEGGAPPIDGGAGELGTGQGGSSTTPIVKECGTQQPHANMSTVIAGFDTAQAEPGVEQFDARRGFAFSVGYGECEPATLTKLEPGPGTARYLRFEGNGPCSMVEGDAVTLVIPFNATGFANIDRSTPPDTMCPYSASGYTGFNFMARSETSNNLQVAVLTPTTVSITDPVPGGTCQNNCAPRAVNVTLTPSWQPYQVLFETLQTDPTQLLGIQFQSTATSENMFDIDQLNFIGAP